MPASLRTMTPELLDHLDPKDPRAIRSRRDLRLVNGFLGNSRWILRELRRRRVEREKIVEIGAGEGTLCRAVHGALPRASVTGLDLTPRPVSLEPEVQWLSGDFFETLSSIRGDICIGSLILHHFSGEMLSELGEHLEEFSLLLFCEPHRSSLPLVLARLARPFAGEVTRHDMPASTHAGFRKGELPDLLGLDTGTWQIREAALWRGSLRMIASRHRSSD